MRRTGFLPMFRALVPRFVFGAVDSINRRDGRQASFLAGVDRVEPDGSAGRKRGRKARVIAHLRILVVALALVVAAGAAAAADKIKVTIAANDPSYAAYFVAIEKGYFRAADLDLEMISAGGGA